MEKKELMCKILKSLNDNKEPKASEYNVDLELFGSVVETMQSSGLIRNAKVTRGGTKRDVISTYLDNAKITPDGLRDLEKCDN